LCQQTQIELFIFLIFKQTFFMKSIFNEAIVANTEAVKGGTHRPRPVHPQAGTATVTVEIPAITIPKVVIPKVEIPKVVIPKVVIPKVETPKVVAPKAPIHRPATFICH
jgi:hypothetical protein